MTIPEPPLPPLNDPLPELDAPSPPFPVFANALGPVALLLELPPIPPVA